MKTSHKLLIALIASLFIITTVIISMARYFVTVTVH